MMVDVSVIIPTYNEERDIRNCLESLEKQFYKNFEIIIVDDGSTDKTREIVKQFNIKLIEGEHKGPGLSRNKGAKEARGEILVFVDADMTFDKNYIENLITPIKRNKEIVGTTHDLEIAENTENVWGLLYGEYRVKHRFEKEKYESIKTKKGKPFRAIRKKFFLEKEGFDPRYGYADDKTFFLKYGINPVFAKNTTCYHNNPETLKEIYKQSRWIGASLNNFVLNIPILKYLAPLLLILISPIAIPILSIKKCHKNKSFNLLLPRMLIFMTARYFGTLSGIFRKIYLNSNVR